MDNRILRPVNDVTRILVELQRGTPHAALHQQRLTVTRFSLRSSS